MKSKRIIFTVMQRGRNKMFVVSHVYFCVMYGAEGRKYVCGMTGYI